METTAKLDAKAQAVINDLIVRRGLSYVEAARKAREQGYAASRPYLQAATEIERWLSEEGET